MSHPCRCKYKVTVQNQTKKLQPVGKRNQLQGKVGFCEQVRAYPVGKDLKCR